MNVEISLNAALNICRQGRHIVNPNPGFIKQLMEFQLHLKKMRKKGLDPEQEEMEQRMRKTSQRSIAPSNRVQSQHELRSK